MAKSNETLESVEKRTIKSWVKERIKHVQLYGFSLGVILITCLIFLSVFLKKTPFQLAKEKLVQNPYDFKAHLLLAEEYLKNNQLEEAGKELQWAQKTEVNEASLSLDELWQRRRESQPEEIKKLIEVWEKIILERPNYRDGHLQLALLYYKLYDNEKAKEYLQTALTLDPNFENAKKLEDLLEKN